MAINGSHNEFNKMMKLYRESLLNDNDKEKFYISPPTKTIIKSLVKTWIAFFISFLFTVSGREILLVFFWILLIIYLIYYSNTWSKFGYSIMLYWVINGLVLSCSYGISRVIHYLIGVIFNV